MTESAVAEMQDLVPLEVAPLESNKSIRRGALFALVFQIMSFGLLIGGLIGSSSK
jgi:hypothetical protein